MVRSSAIARLALGATVLLGSAGCGSTQSATVVSSRDRAACSRLEAAYARFNSQTATSASSIRVYRKAITVATAAEDPQLRAAIILWASRMIHPSAGSGIPGAPYATQRCSQIGNPLRIVSGAGSSPPGPSPTGTSPSSSASGQEGGGGD